jgi:LPS-assembly lipoprotein
MNIRLYIHQPSLFHFAGQLLAAILLSLLVVGCGFHLKQSAQIASSFGPVSVEGVGTQSSLYKAIRNILKQSDIKIVDSAAASNRIIISGIKYDRKVLAVGSNGKVSEYELIRSLNFSVINSSNERTIDNQPLAVNRYYTVNTSDVLSDDFEEQDLQRLMDEELADRMFRYIGAKSR